ncbi:putative glycosyltransferase [Brazilian marseillevirus]|uniref:putative glycosyltransferase n=1 Tax=Brazilian marseillevirus TaxID=1813599 RepID=UPI0007842989|nr:putative glycosyltransferase [Brazilian marseillevirus]AMQ10838.1 putative glycosyltransferase [Brazilian marseillevirus]
MQTTYRQVKSLNDVDDCILKSGVQKYVRRNKRDKALWCMVELDFFADATDERAGEAIRSNMLHRLMVIFLEEISVCNILLWFHLAERFSTLFSCKEQRKSLDRESAEWKRLRTLEQKALVWVVSQMCASRHIRILSHTRSAFGHGKSQESLEVASEFYQDFYQALQNFGEDEEAPKTKLVLEKESSETKRLCKNFLSALEQEKYSAYHWASQILELEKVGGRYYKSQRSDLLIFWCLEKFFETRQDSEFLLKIHSVALSWFKELSGIREGFLTWWCLVTMCVVGWQERRLVDDVPNYKEVYQRNLVETIHIDSYVIDKHTKQGRKMGKDSKTFVLEGAFVVREAKIGNPQLRSFYEDINIYRLSGIKGVRRQRVAKESDIFEFVVRAQLVCGTGKTDTYFAKEKSTGKRVLVKGPFRTKDSIKNVLSIAKIKKLLGLPFVRVRRMALRPDLFEDSVMGVRSRMKDRDVISCFLVFDDETTEETLPITLRKGNVTPETEVVDWERVESMRHFNVLQHEDREILFVFCIAIVFRYILGLPDLADRNFLYVPRKNTVISIDEDVCGREVDLEAALKKNRYAKYREILEENRDRVQETLENWEDILSKKKLELPVGTTLDSVFERMKKIF